MRPVLFRSPRLFLLLILSVANVVAAATASVMEHNNAVQQQQPQEPSSSSSSSLTTMATEDNDSSLWMLLSRAKLLEEAAHAAQHHHHQNAVMTTTSTTNDPTTTTTTTKQDMTQLLHLIDTTVSLVVSKFLQDVLQRKMMEEIDASSSEQPQPQGLRGGGSDTETTGAMRTIVVDGSDLDAHVVLTSSSSSSTSSQPRSLDQWWQDHMMMMKTTATTTNTTTGLQDQDEDEGDNILLVDSNKLEVWIQHQVNHPILHDERTDKVLYEMSSSSSLSKKHHHHHHHPINHIRIQWTDTAKSKMMRMAHLEGMDSLERLLFSSSSSSLSTTTMDDSDDDDDGRQRALQEGTEFGLIGTIFDIIAGIFNLFGLTWFTAFSPLCLPLQTVIPSFDICATIFFNLVEFVVSLYIELFVDDPAIWLPFSEQTLPPEEEGGEDGTAGGGGAGFFWGWIAPSVPDNFTPRIMTENHQVDFVVQETGMSFGSSSGTGQQVPADVYKMAASITEGVWEDLYVSTMQEGESWETAVSNNVVLQTIRNVQEQQQQEDP